MSYLHFCTDTGQSVRIFQNLTQHFEHLHLIRLYTLSQQKQTEMKTLQQQYIICNVVLNGAFWTCSAVSCLCQVMNILYYALTKLN